MPDPPRDAAEDRRRLSGAANELYRIVVGQNLTADIRVIGTSTPGKFQMQLANSAEQSLSLAMVMATSPHTLGEGVARGNVELHLPQESCAPFCAGSGTYTEGEIRVPPPPPPPPPPPQGVVDACDTSMCLGVKCSAINNFHLTRFPVKTFQEGTCGKLSQANCCQDCCLAASPPLLPAQSPPPPPAAPPPPKNEYTYGAGGWGGECECPDGQKYAVGDQYDSCGSLACINGKAGTCKRENGPHSNRKVICAPLPPSA